MTGQEGELVEVTIVDIDLEDALMLVFDVGIEAN